MTIIAAFLNCIWIKGETRAKKQVLAPKTFCKLDSTNLFCHTTLSLKMSHF